MFKVCKKCDFEWHSKDGLDCPACSRESEKTVQEYQPVLSSKKRWVQILAIVMLVSLIVLWILR